MKKIIFILTIISLSIIMTACQNTAQEDSSSDAVTLSGDSENTYTEFNKDAAFEETVLYDKNDIKITAARLEFLEYRAELDLIIENNSDKNLTFESDNRYNSVNGYMVRGGSMNCSLAAGESTEFTMNFGYHHIRCFGIYEIADIEIDIDIRDDEKNLLYNEKFQIKTSDYDSHDYTSDPFQAAVSDNSFLDEYGYSVIYSSDNILYDKDDVKVFSELLVKDKEGHYIFFTEVENRSEKKLFVGTQNVMLNGLLIEDILGPSIYANSGKNGILVMEFSDLLDDNSWDVFSIKDIGSIEFDLNIINVNDHQQRNTEKVKIIIPDTEALFDGSGTEVYNDNNIRIISKKAVNEASEVFSNRIHILLLAENKNQYDIDIHDTAAFINGYDMGTFLFSYTKVPAMRSAVIDGSFFEMEFEGGSILTSEDIRNFEVTFEIMDSEKNIIDTPTIYIEYPEIKKSPADTEEKVNPPVNFD